MGLGFYTYFASRGVPLIVAAFLVYAALVAWPLVKNKWRGLAWLFGLALLLALPLLLTLQAQPSQRRGWASWLCRSSPPAPVILAPYSAMFR
ncbi:MAG: hypothetical protein M5U34_03065 [Chloroflexi bacterium]|nr:hypothetical protein [Chloroflexota bacterium]